MKIRRATLKNLAALIPLNTLFIHEMRKRFPAHFPFKPRADFVGNVRRLTRSMIAQKAYVTLIAEEQGQLVAFIHGTLSSKVPCLYPSHKVIVVEDLYVVKEFRSSGVATRLFSELKKVAKAKGCALIQLFVLPTNPAKKIYEKWGFRTQTEKMMLKL